MSRKPQTQKNLCSKKNRTKHVLRDLFTVLCAFSLVLSSCGIAFAGQVTSATNKASEATAQEYVTQEETCTHEWDYGTITKEPTCTKTGETTFTCSLCGETKVESIKALGHDWGAWKVTKEATKTEEGTKERTCERCGKVQEASIDPTGEGSGSGEGGETVDPKDDWTNSTVSVEGVYKINAYSDWLLDTKQDPNVSGTKVTINENNGRMRIRLSENLTNKATKKADGKLTYSYDEGDENWVNISPRYTSSDESVISVDNNGILTAHKNSTKGVTITIYASYKNAEFKTTLKVYAKNQDAADATKIVLLDSNGNKLEKDDQITFDDSSDSRYYQFYVRVTYADNTTSSTYPKASDYDSNLKTPRLTGGRLSWLVNNEDVGYINAESGRFKALDDGLVKVTASCGTVSASIWVHINTGKYADAYMPSDHLTIKIVYELDEDKVFFEETYSIAEVSSWGLGYYYYTLTRSSSKYVSDYALGVPIKTICAKVGVNTEEVRGFRLAANDGKNPGFLGAQLLLANRYTYPNYDVGGSLQGAYTVPAILAIADNWTDNDMVSKDATLNNGTCFRLLFGSTSRSDNLTGQSLKYINTLTIVMQGSAPTTNGDGDDNGEGNDEGDSDGDGDSESDGEGDGEIHGTTGGNVSLDASDLTEVTGEKIQQSGSSAKWQVYQMMTKQESDIDSLEMEYPYTPYALPVALLILFSGVAATLISYKVQRGKKNKKTNSKGKK